MIPAEKFCAAVGDANCIRKPEQLHVYESDVLATFLATPGVVVLPSTT